MYKLKFDKLIQNSFYTISPLLISSYSFLIFSVIFLFESAMEQQILAKEARMKALLAAWILDWPAVTQNAVALLAYLDHHPSQKDNIVDGQTFAANASLMAEFALLSALHSEIFNINNNFKKEEWLLSLDIIRSCSGLAFLKLAHALHCESCQACIFCTGN